MDSFVRSSTAGFVLAVVVVAISFALTVPYDQLRCDTTTPRVGSHYSLGHDYRPFFRRVLLEDGEEKRQLSLDERSTTVISDVALEIDPNYHELWIRVINGSADPVTLHWSEAAFIDENGARRPVDSIASGEPDPPTLVFPVRDAIVPPQTSGIERAWPRGKVYYTAYNCRDASIFREDLVPAKLLGSEAAEKAAVDRIVEKQIPVVFEIPMSLGARRKVLSVEIVFDDQLRHIPRAGKEGEQS